jgi:hypothetical protein
MHIKADVNRLVTTVSSYVTDDISYLNSTACTQPTDVKADVNRLVTTASSCPTDDISYLNSTACEWPTNVKADITQQLCQPIFSQRN